MNQGRTITVFAFNRASWADTSHNDAICLVNLLPFETNPLLF